MNIWCISKYAAVPPYGAGARLFYLAKGFIKLGHNAILITSDANHLTQFPDTKIAYNYEESEGVSVYWLKTKKYKKTFSVARVLSWLDFERRLFGFKNKELDSPDVVIISSLSIFSIIYGLYLKKKFKAFLAFEIRDIWPLTMTEEAGFSKYHPLVVLIGFLERLGYKHADLVVGTMPRLDLHVKNILGYERPFLCSPLGFNEDNYQEENIDEHSNPFNDVFPSNKVIVGYSGSMGITNALESFISVIERLKDNQDLHFMLVGGGDLKQAFEEQLSNCSNVTFLPRIQQNEVKFFLAKCDIVYLSTKDSKVWDYGQSMNKIVEYMLAGKPVIASYTGYPSMLNEAECGQFICPKGDESPEDNIQEALLRIASMTPEDRQQLGQKGKAWIKQYRNYRFLSQQYINKIKELMND